PGSAVPRLAVPAPWGGAGGRLLRAHPAWRQVRTPLPLARRCIPARRAVRRRVGRRPTCGAVVPSSSVAVPPRRSAVPRRVAVALLAVTALIAGCSDGRDALGAAATTAPATTA